MRSRLLLGILMPVGLMVLVNAWSLYQQSLQAANTAYDRTLLASAKSIGERLELSTDARGQLRLLSLVPYSALEAFESDNRSQLYYRVAGFEGQQIAGYPDLPAWRKRVPQPGPYAALVDFYDDIYQGQPVRMAVLQQPVASEHGQGMATIQVAETLELRHTLARQILLDTVWRQAALLALISGVVLWVVHRITGPVRQLSDGLRARAEADLSPLALDEAPRELRPLLEATNQVMARLSELLAQRQRFVRDAAHQLRTPLAVLKTQVQSARRADLPAEQALAEIAITVDGATELANQMLALAKVEQLRQGGDAPLADWQAEVRAVALDLAPLIVAQDIDFDLDTTPAHVKAHVWALRELVRNLLHNAIRHTPREGQISMRLWLQDQQACLVITDNGPGLSDSALGRLYQPFATGLAATRAGAEPTVLPRPSGGVGLGLVICQDIVRSLGGTLVLRNRAELVPGTPGLEALVRLPLASAESALQASQTIPIHGV